MTQNEKRMIRYEEVVSSIEANHRNPWKHCIEEYNMLSWIKQQRKLINAGTFKPDRMNKFEKLEKLFNDNKRLNQWV